MTGQQIAQLIIALGPAALRLIPSLVTIWNRELSVEEVIQYVSLAEKSYDTYIAEAKAKLVPVVNPS